MPYSVDLPDGRSVEFPDSVSQDQAAAIIRSQLLGTQAPAGQPAPAPAAQAPQPTPFAGDQTAAAMSSYGFGDTFKGLGTSIAEQIKQIGYGYVLNRADEAAKLFEGTEGSSREKLNAVTNEYIEKLKQSDERIKAATPQDLNVLEQGIRSGIESIVVAAPGLAASFVTKSPYPAVAAAGLQTKFGSYGQARQEGLTPKQAELYGNIDGALEAATEFLPTEFLMKSFGAKSLKGVKQELVKFALGEGLGEQVATATQSLNAYANGLDKELEQAKTWQEAAEIQAKRQAITALATIVTGGVFAGGAAAVGKYREFAEKGRPTAPPSAEPTAPEEPTPAPQAAPPAEPTAPEPKAVTPAVPEGVASIEDLLGIAPAKRAETIEEEGPPPYTESEVPPTAEEGEATPVAAKEEKKVEETVPPVPEGYTRLWRTESAEPDFEIPDWMYEVPGFKESVEARGRWFSDADEARREWYRKEAGANFREKYIDVPNEQVKAYSVKNSPEALKFSREPDFEYFLPKDVADQAVEIGKPITPITEKVTAPETKLPEPAQLTLPTVEAPPAEDLVQRSAFAAPYPPRSYDLSALLSEAPSGIAEPSVGETVGGAGLRGTELPVSRPEPEGQGVAEPAGAGVELPVYGATRADEGAARVKPALDPALKKRIDDEKEITVESLSQGRKRPLAIFGNDTPEGIKSLQRTAQDPNLPVIDTGSSQYYTAYWNELPNGYAYRQVKVTDNDLGVQPTRVVQEIRFPLTSEQLNGDDFPDIASRYIEENGNTGWSIDAHQLKTLGELFGDKSFNDFNRVFAGELTLEPPAAPVKTAEELIAEMRKEDFEKDYVSKNFPLIENADSLSGLANKTVRDAIKIQTSLSDLYRDFSKKRWGKPVGSAKEVSKSIKTGARFALFNFLQRTTGSKKKTLPALINDFHAMLDRQQKAAITLLDKIDPEQNVSRPDIGKALDESIKDFSNVNKALEETMLAWSRVDDAIKNIKAAQDLRAQKTAPAPNAELFSITPQATVNMWADPAFAPRAPGFKPRVKQIVNQARNGIVSAESAVEQIGKLAETPETRERAPVVRDVAHFKARLTQALRQGRINQATHDLTQWLIGKNPKLIEGLGLSISTRDPSGRRIPLGVQGLYSVVQDIVTLVPRANSDVTLVHEILHRAERMMPSDIQAQIRKIWERQLFANLRTAEMRGNEFEKDFYNRLVEYHFGDRNSPEDLKALQDIIKTGAVPAESYQFMNPSEFWAVNASRIMQNRFKASPTFVARVKQWLKEFAERIKGIMDLPSDAPFLRAMDKVMKGKGEFISPTIHGDERLNSIDRQTRYKGWKSEERQYRDGEELILRRANRNREIQKPPSPDQMIKESLTKKAYEEFVDKAQSILRPWKRERQRLENEGKLIEDGPNANDVYGILAQATGIARWYDNMYVMPIERRLYDNISVYGKEKGVSPEDALEFFAQFRQAMSADLRRDELFRRYVPLSTKNIYQLSNGKKMAPAAVRLQLYRKAAELLGNQNIPQAQKRKMLDDIRAHLDAIVSNKEYLDPLGHSMYAGRPIDSSGNNLEMSTNWDAAFYSPAEGTDPILHTGPTLSVLEKDLAEYPSLRKAMDEFNKLQEVTKNLKRRAGVWNEYMDDVSYFYGWGDGYSPLMMEKEDSPLNLEGTRNSGDVSTFVPGMQGGVHRVTNAVFQSLANAHRAASIAARGPITQRIANLINTGQIPGAHMIDISPREQFMLALENQPVPTDVMGGNVIIHTLPDGTKQVYRMDADNERGKKLLDGVRRVNEELPKGINKLSKVQGVLASQFTRLRAPFAPGQFVMDSMTLAPMISAEYGLRFGPQFLAKATANLATLKGPKLPKLLNLYREGNEAALREYVKDDPFLADVVNYIKEGGPSAYAEAYKIEKGLTNYVRSIKQSPFSSAAESFGDLVDNWTDSWDLLSRVSAMSVLKGRELEKAGYDNVVKEKGVDSPEAKRIMKTAIKRAAHQAKELSNFNLHGNMTSRKIAAFYMFWRPNVTTAIATADMIGKAFERPEARIERELSPEAQQDQELVAQKLKEFTDQRNRTRTVLAIMMGAGMALYELARAMSDYDEEGRNKVAASDKGQWIRAAQFRIPGTDWNFNAMFGFGPGGFLSLGAQMSALLHGDQPVSDFSKNSLNTILSMFTPITPAQIDVTKDFTKWFLATFSPSLFKPIVEYAQNLTAIDTEIYNAHPSRFSEIYSGGKNVPDMYKQLSKWWLETTGEEVAPNKMYFFASHFAQAVNDVAVMGFDIKSALLGDKNAEDINWKPLAGSFISRVGNTDAREYADLEPAILEAQHRLSMFETDRPIAEKLRAEHPDDAKIVGIYNSTKYQIQQYQTMRNQLNRSNLPLKLKRERLDEVEAAMNKLKYVTVSAIKQVKLSKQVSKP